MFHQPPREMERLCFKQLCTRLGAIWVLSMLRSCQQEEIPRGGASVCSGSFSSCFVQCWIIWYYVPVYDIPLQLLKALVLSRLSCWCSYFCQSHWHDLNLDWWGAVASNGWALRKSWHCSLQHAAMAPCQFTAALPMKRGRLLLGFQVKQFALQESRMQLIIAWSQASPLLHFQSW